MNEMNKKIKEDFVGGLKKLSGLFNPRWML